MFLFCLNCSHIVPAWILSPSSAATTSSTHMTSSATIQRRASPGCWSRHGYLAPGMVLRLVIAYAQSRPSADRYSVHIWTNLIKFDGFALEKKRS